MLTVAEALRAINAVVVRGPVVAVALEQALGMVLAETIVSDCDSPPFDKSQMDGYAIRVADLVEGTAELTVIEEVTAGRIPTHAIEAGQATRIMTGAPIPEGADAVVPVEETSTPAFSSTATAPRVAIRTTKPPLCGQFILKQGSAVRRGAHIMSPGRMLRAQEIAALAELGHSDVKVSPRPTAAILATGDELVPSTETPGPGQIRNSNEPMLAAQVQQLGAVPVRLGIAKDDRSHLAERVKEGLKCDFLLLSGGVSAGRLDLVPSVLAESGVRQIFHKIQMKPGKPLWFGLLERPNGQPPCLVFGLPGNPVSSMACCELFVRPAVRGWFGLEPVSPAPIEARLSMDLSSSNNRPTYHPAHVTWTAQGPVVRLVDWIGSSDLCATIDANCLALLPAGDHNWQAGQSLSVFPWS